MKEYIKSLGFEEIQPDLWLKRISETIRFYIDYRQGYRWCYAFNENGSCNYTDFEEYKRIKAYEEGTKCITLDNFGEKNGTAIS